MKIRPYKNLSTEQLQKIKADAIRVSNELAIEQIDEELALRNIKAKPGAKTTPEAKDETVAGSSNNGDD